MRLPLSPHDNVLETSRNLFLVTLAAPLVPVYCRFDWGIGLRLSSTEQRNPRSRRLDEKSTLGILRIINREDERVAVAVRRELSQIARAVDAIVLSLANGGRVFYVGAGTSGRLAALDAAECPPTFGMRAESVQALIAGGTRTMRGADESAEDSARSGARDLTKAGVLRRDVVVGLAASGTTPYVLGAIEFARRRGSITIGVTSNPQSPLAQRAKIAIVPETGPEVIAGSTRLKAGTAQKMVLNLLSTTAMVRLGRVYDNWMIYVALTNKKLRRRGARILEEATGVSASEAEHALRKTGHNLPAALIVLKTGTNAQDAKSLLAKSGGNLRAALKASQALQARTKRGSE